MTPEQLPNLFIYYGVAASVLFVFGGASIWFLRSFIRRRIWPVPSTIFTPWWKQFLNGCGYALITLVISILPALLLGGFSPSNNRWQAFSYDLTLPGAKGFGTLWSLFTVQSLYEELLFRAIALALFGMFIIFLADVVGTFSASRKQEPSYRLSARVWLWVGIISTIVVSIAFSYVHLDNPGISPIAAGNIALAGVALGLLFWIDGNVLGAWGYHLVWNTGLATLGLPVSGIGFTSTPILQGAVPGLMTGGAFGPEASVINSIALFIVIIWLVRKGSRSIDTSQSPQQTNELTAGDINLDTTDNSGDQVN